MTLALGICYSLAIGVGDFFGGYLARRSQAFTVVITFLVFGAITAAGLLLVVDSALRWDDVGFGALSGLTVGFALVFLYHGIAVASAAVVSPITALFAAVIPVGWSVSTGEELAALVVVGIVVALVGLGLTTFSPELGERAVAGAGWGTASGLCFGVALTFLGQASLDSGMWATVSQRSTALVFLAAIAVHRGIPRIVAASHLRVGIIGGVLTGLGVAAFVGGAQRGSLSELTVTASMFPAVTAVLGAVFDHHPLRWWQVSGLAVVVAGVVLIGVG